MSGTGKSSVLAELARRGHRVIDTDYGGWAVVVGHHTGAAVAIEMAASAPARVDALVLSSAPWTDEAYRESLPDERGPTLTCRSG